MVQGAHEQGYRCFVTQGIYTTVFQSRLSSETNVNRKDGLKALACSTRLGQTR